MEERLKWHTDRPTDPAFWAEKKKPRMFDYLGGYGSSPFFVVVTPKDYFTKCAIARAVKDE